MAEIRCLLREAAAIFGSEPALIQGGHVVLYSQFDLLVDDTAAWLRERGVRHGDRVALLPSNDWRSVVLLLGLQRAGATACPLNTRLPPEALAEQLRRIACPVLVGDFKGRDRTTREGVTCWDLGALVDTGTRPPEAPRVDRLPLQHPAVIVFTSGSLKARAAALSFGNLYYAARASNRHLPLRSRDRWLLQLPLYHVAGLGIVYRCLQAGATLVLPDGERPLPDQLMNYGVTHLSLVPAQLKTVLELDRGPEALAALKVLLLGGSAVSPALHEAAMRAGVPMCRSYGMTETTAQACTVDPSAPPARRASSGRPLPGVEIEMDGEGEIRVRGRTVFLGYVEGADLHPALDPDGWFHTGDLGAWDAAGSLHVTGRIDNRFVSGGENIQPEAIEQELLSLPGIEKAVVVPVPHDRFGMRPVAFLAGAPPPVEQLKAALTERLPPYMIPDRFLPWPDDLSEPALKPPRRELERRAREEA